MAPGMGKKNQNPVGDKSITVADYSWQFFERVLQNKYGDTEEENAQKAGENFHTLISKLQDSGSKDDVKVPLRVLRDQIGRVYFASGNQQQSAQIETLFKLYDGLEEHLQKQLREHGSTQDAIHAAALLEELRLRFYRLAIGDTWEQYAELKLKALKRMQQYAMKEKGQARMSGTVSAAGSARKLKWSRSGAGASGGAHASWQGTIDELAKAPSARLFPFVKALLAEVVTGQPPNAEASTPSAAEASTRPSLETVPSDVPSEASSKPAAMESKKSMAREGGQGTGSKLADLHLDDLLGLTDPIPEESPLQTPKPATPSAFDPFNSQPQNGSQSAFRSVDSSPSAASISAFSQAPPQAPSQAPQAPQGSYQGPQLQQHGSQPFHGTQQPQQPQQQYSQQPQEQQYGQQPHQQLSGQGPQQQYGQQPTQQYNGQQQGQQQQPQWAQSPTQLPQHPSGGFSGPRQSLDQPGQQSSAQQFGQQPVSPGFGQASSANPFGGPTFSGNLRGLNSLGSNDFSRSQDASRQGSLAPTQSGTLASPGTGVPPASLGSSAMARQVSANMAPPSQQQFAQVHGPTPGQASPSSQAAAATQQHSSWGPPVAQFHAPPPNAAQQGKSGDWGSQPEAFAASQAPKGIGASGEGFEGSAFGQPAAFTPGAQPSGGFDAFGLQPSSSNASAQFQRQPSHGMQRATSQHVPQPMRAAPAPPPAPQSQGSTQWSAW